MQIEGGRERGRERGRDKLASTLVSVLQMVPGHMASWHLYLTVIECSTDYHNRL